MYRFSQSGSDWLNLSSYSLIEKSIVVHISPVTVTHNVHNQTKQGRAKNKEHARTRTININSTTVCQYVTASHSL